METTLSAIQGSALIAFGLIPPLCAFTTCEPLAVSWAPLLRDTIAYIVSLMALVCFMQDSIVTVWEASMLCLTYVVYLMAIYLPVYFNPTYTACVLLKDETSATSLSKLLDPADHAAPTYGSSSFDPVPLDPTSSPKPWARVCQAVKRLGRVCSVPCRTLFKLTLPDSNSSLYFVTIVLSLAYVTVFSAGVLYCTRKISADLHLSTTTTGVTLLALGAQIPDAIASVSLARAGHADAAVCNAIGSQVINVSLGSGLPLAISTFYYGSVNMAYENEIMLWKSLAVVIGSYLLLNFNFRSVFCLYDANPKDNFIGLTKGDGAILLTLYLLCNAAITITS
ncbi:hypothetical protein H310_05931 [Aphanomyces invadans]|uniref:Sodium/calcium exchanger membrane region domain-containing protein n=1 Tax=Aphanomyces invadans TaxID=157072 RepID=A0A024U987_9STRA|nr:hypothetical protein H310_05931 [Aphanomyces invadans]ETW02417.1 hypothetical protein H310_05931 [Aphanomyces invadans]|eukprot:XP_008869022.1 hypothetical protein H310_05931 [Aphanomyces invadans]